MPNWAKARLSLAFDASMYNCLDLSISSGTSPRDQL